MRIKTHVVPAIGAFKFLNYHVSKPDADAIQRSRVGFIQQKILVVVHMAKLRTLSLYTCAHRKVLVNKHVHVSNATHVDGSESSCSSSRDDQLPCFC